MNEEKQKVSRRDGASSARSDSWSAINWQDMTQRVRRLQERIAKAVKENRWNKVASLQRILVRSYPARLLAVRKVTSSKGKRTPGVDGERWLTQRQKTEAVTRLCQKGYRPKPLRRVSILKSNGGKRHLGIPTMLDRAMQALHALALNPVAETKADPNSYGFREKRGVADAVEQAANCLSHQGSAVWILEGDIKACFDRIDHQWMLDHIPMDQRVLKGWLKAGYMEKDALHPTRAGTPQGGSISPVLANMVLDGLEGVVGALADKRQYKLHFIRYADDFIVTSNCPTLLEHEVKPAIIKFLTERGLELSKEKTRITHIDDGFDFLGITFRKFKGKLLCLPAKAKVLHFLNRIRKVIKAYRTVKTEGISRLNRMLRGWAQFYRTVAAKRTFSYIDHQVFKALWRWARRRHPRKSRGLKDKYFHVVGFRKGYSVRTI